MISGGWPPINATDKNFPVPYRGVSMRGGLGPKCILSDTDKIHFEAGHPPTSTAGMTGEFLDFRAQKSLLNQCFLASKIQKIQEIHCPNLRQRMSNQCFLASPAPELCPVWTTNILKPDMNINILKGLIWISNILKACTDNTITKGLHGQYNN